MSFFGFDTTLPRDRTSASETRGIFETPDPFAEVAQATVQDDGDAIDFEDTYEGLGDQLDEADDALNEDTFGDAAGTADAPVGKDFDFYGNTAQMASVLGEEQALYNRNRQEESAAGPAKSPSKPKRTGYEPYQDPDYIPDLQAKSSVWGITAKKDKQEDQTTPAITATSAPAKKMLSLEEVEAQIRAQSQRSQIPAQPTVPAPVPVSQIPSSLPQGMPPQLPPGLPVHDHPLQPHDGLPMPPPPMSIQDFPPLNHYQGRFGQIGREGFPPQPAGYQQPISRPSVPPGIPVPMLQHQQRPQQLPQPHRPGGPVQAVYQQPQATTGLRGPPAAAPTIPPNFMQMTEEQRQAFLAEDAKRAKRNHKIFLLSKGNGLMTPQDKNFITRIQLQQLVAAAGNLSGADPESILAEDFYYQVYSQIRGAPRQHPRQPLGHFAQTYLLQTSGRAGGHGRRQLHHADNHMQRMQQQVQRAVEAAKLRPKNKQLIIEGSLGKISFSNAKTPKTMLSIKRPDSSDGVKNANIKKASDGTTPSPSDRKTILHNIECAYLTLMKMEDHERNMPPSPDETDAEAVERHLEWRQKLKTLNDQLWNDIKVLDPIVPASDSPHPFIAFLSFGKGKKAIPRIFRHIDQEQKVTILTMIVVHLDSLDVVKNAQLSPGESQPPASVREDIDLFSHAVMPCLLGYVNEAPMNIIIGLLGLVIGQTDVQRVSKTKIGLGILTMLLSRAELVKEAGTASDADWKQWTDLYNRLFDRLEPVLGDIFPGTINTGDDMYVWQFLAAVGIGASPEQQQRLVIAVKDRVMETVAQSKTLPADMASQRLGNVNLFMRAIGLDVELLE
ncbi:hypothetical protein VTO42DRAFT_8482 [Malbranchea cinnamomea]